MSLRSILTALMAILGLLAFSAAAALLVLTAALHRSADRLGTEIEKVRLTGELEIALLSTTPPVPGVLPPEKLRQRLDDLQSYLTTPEGRAQLEQARAMLRRWHAAARSQPAPNTPPPRELLDTVAAFDRLAALGIDQAHQSLARAERWTHLADLIAWAVGVALFLSVGASLLWLYGLAFAPAARIEESMQRFADGDPRARAAERGPQELRSIARQFNALADELGRRRGHELAVLAGIAHDLRNPLTAIKTALAVAAPDRPLPPEPRLRHLLALVGRQLDRLTRMTGDLIDGARLESGRLELEVAAQELRGIVADVVDLYRAASPNRDLQLSMPQTPLVVDGDATRLSQLLGNLLTNAIKYSPAGSTIRVEVRRVADNAAVAVTNSGPGIVAEEQAHVFEPFRRGGGDPTVPGVGLGLFVAQRIAQAHGGRLRLVSQPGAKTTFTLELPLAEAVTERAVDRDHRPEETPA